MDIKKALTIAGSDASGAAGMAADLKIFEEFGVYGMVSLTVIVAMNKNNWNHEIFPIDIETIKKQLETNLFGIIPDAVKTGMLGSKELVHVVYENLMKAKIKNIVIDPVMVCKGSDEIMIPEAAKALKETLVPIATIVTPNIVEAKILAGMEEIKSLSDLKIAAKKIYNLGAKNVVIKSGSRNDEDAMTNLFFDGKEYYLYDLPKYKNKFNSGAGCSFSAGICANLAKGYSPQKAVEISQEFVSNSIKNSFSLNKFHGAMANFVK